MVAPDEVLKNEAVRAYILRMIGEEGMELIEKFPPEGEYSDEDLAEVTQINLNTVRHTLYTLYGKRLAEYRRIKNAETGWLTYLWVLKLENMNSCLYEDIDSVLEILEAREKYETMNDFYICQKCGLRYTFDEALNRDFVCQNCNEKMEHFDNELLAEALKSRVDKIKENMGRV
ncbi:transcription initiation factor TFIIE subunit alpha [Methanomicrobium sp. W14]|uniref:transcription factor n=1 Tax=Methanomicrobium sp. W14 TaxID=2817839 RepID=UPI001AE60323|nr:transcription factor [Methanomicrobium sp. W14]MBP2132584.1 transcription initiation factor TFIIE subunit alpha [Methanomicrobium sp. W14]